MYRCKECGAEFEDLVECHQDGGCYETDYGVGSLFPDHHYYPSVDYMGCPNCGAEASACYELEYCNRCGRYVNELYDGLCEDCCDELEK